MCTKFSSLFDFFFLSVLIYFKRQRERERERESEQRRGRKRGRERESQAGSTPSAQSQTRGSNSRTVRSRPEPYLTEPPRHPCLSFYNMHKTITYSNRHRFSLTISFIPPNFKESFPNSRGLIKLKFSPCFNFYNLTL